MRSPVVAAHCAARQTPYMQGLMQYHELDRCSNLSMGWGCLVIYQIIYWTAQAAMRCSAKRLSDRGQQASKITQGAHNKAQYGMT